jgi:hypothetical protein
MIEVRKKLPSEADVSAACDNSRKGSKPDSARSILVSLTDIAVYMRMRQLALRAGRWHEACTMTRAGGSA